VLLLGFVAAAANATATVAAVYVVPAVEVDVAELVAVDD
jgi:hypothetical protein